MKLDKQEKRYLKDFKKENKGEFFTNGKVTAYVEKTGHGKAFISWSICAKDEVFNKKVGQMVAANRWLDGFCLPIAFNPENYSLAYSVDMLMCWVS